MSPAAMYFVRQFPLVPIQLSLCFFVMFNVPDEIHISLKIFLAKNCICDSFNYIHSPPGVIDCESLFFK